MEQPINQHQCLSCCLKHIASALVLAGEIKTGYDTPAYHLYLLGNLAEAQEQVALRLPSLANQLRAIRLDIFGDGGTARLTPMATQRLITVAENLREIIAAESGTPAVKRKRICNCAAKIPAK